MREPLTPSPYLHQSIVMSVYRPRVSSLNCFTADASLVRDRAKYHYDPQRGLDFFESETEGDSTEALPALGRFRQYFRPTHERMKKLMYFC